MIEINDLVKIINSKLKKSAYPLTVISKSVIIAKIAMENALTLDYNNDMIYVGLMRIKEEEDSIIRNIKRLKASSRPLIENPEIEDKRANQEQIECFNALKTSGVKIITGPPGSGKTSVVIRGLIATYQKAFPESNIKLCATTGQASKVLRSEIGLRSTTIHKMLNIRPFEGKKKIQELDAGLIIADEFSMCGLQLFSYLMQAVKSGALLILVGDEDQLQSVDYGNCMHDLIESGVIEVYRLNKVMRQGGVIYENSVKVNQGIEQLECNDDFQIQRHSCQEQIYHALKKEYSVNESIVTPIKGQLVGTKNLNKMAQEKHQLEVPLMQYGDKTFYYNDMIRMVSTNYEKNYINGDIGYITGYKDGVVTIEIDNTEIKLCRSEFKDFDLAYVHTIHRVQGMEMNELNIVLPMVRMLSRRLLYTAITRAKKKVRIYSEGNALELAIKNTNETKRNTLLMYKLRQELQ